MAIAREMTRRGMRTKHGDPWSARAVAQMLARAKSLPVRGRKACLADAPGPLLPARSDSADFQTLPDFRLWA